MAWAPRGGREGCSSHRVSSSQGARSRGVGEPTYRASRGGNFQSDSTAFGAVSSTSASPSVSPVSFICSPHLSFANHERQAAQSPEHEGRSREAGFFTHVGSLPFLLTGWPHDPV